MRAWLTAGEGTRGAVLDEAGPADDAQPRHGGDDVHAQLAPAWGEGWGWGWGRSWGWELGLGLGSGLGLGLGLGAWEARTCRSR